MKLALSSLAVAAVLALGASTALAASGSSRATPAAAEAPLKGAAYQHAHKAFGAFNAGRYEEAQLAARRAIALRPDVLRLRLLLVYALQKQGRNDEALKAISDAQAAGLHSDELTQAQRNLQASASNTATSAFRAGFPIATQAFTDYNAQQYASSAALAEKAFRIDTSQGTWALLWIAALEAQGKLQEAVDAADKALALGAPNKSDLIARKETIFKEMSTTPAVSAYQALGGNDNATAVSKAREAVKLSPDTHSHRLLLMTALLIDEDMSGGESAASDALKQDDEDTTSLVLRAYFRQRQQKTDDANQDFDDALKQDWIDDDQRASIRLIAADAALASGQYDRARELLAPMDANDKFVQRRLKDAEKNPRPPKQLTSLNYPPPYQDCHDTPYGTACELRPSDDVRATTPSGLAYAAYGRQDYQEAIKQAEIAVKQDPDNPVMQRLLTIALAAGEKTQQDQALQRLNADIATSPGEASLLMQRAYLHQRRSAMDQALADFRAARATGKAPKTVILDEGYALASAGHKDEAVTTFKQAIDMDDRKELSLTQEQRYFTRSSIANLSREWGASASVSYRGARAAGAGINGAPITTASDSVFGMAEVYWRPRQFLNDSKRVFEVYARTMSTLDAGSSSSRAQNVVDPCTGLPMAVDAANYSGVSGFPSTTGSIGMRFTPSTDYALTFGLERRFLLGSATRSGTVTPQSADMRCQLNGRDPSRPGAPIVGNPQTIHFDSNASDGGWLGYVTYGFYRGTGLRLDVPDWFTMEGYVQAGLYREDLSARYWSTDAVTGQSTPSRKGKYRRDQWFANAEMRVGRSFRMDSVSERFVLFPHAVLAADYQRQDYRARVPGYPYSMDVLGNGSTWSSGVGVGVSARYAFREDHYNAPRSYVDWTIQYRTNLGGGAADRAKGWFMNFSVWY